MTRLLWAGLVAIVATFGIEATAHAQGERPVMVEYIAPAVECPSAGAFQRQVEGEVARWPNDHRLWRFSVRISRDAAGHYQGLVTTERGVHAEVAARCEDLTATLATVVATSEAEAPPCAPPPPPPEGPRPTPPPDRTITRPREPVGPAWRVGLRGDISNHGSSGTVLAGGRGVVSLEVPGGIEKMMFELGVGGSTATNSANQIHYVIADAQACLVDVALGRSGFAFLGCLRLAAAQFTSSTYAPVYESSMGFVRGSGGAVWTGAGARLRWQSSSGLFLEATTNAMYGTVSAGEPNTPGWVDASLGVGFRL